MRCGMDACQWMLVIVVALLALHMKMVECVERDPCTDTYLSEGGLQDPCDQICGMAESMQKCRMKCPACYKKSQEKVRKGPTNVDEGPTNIDKGPTNMDKGPTNVDKGPTNVDERQNIDVETDPCTDTYQSETGLQDPCDQICGMVESMQKCRMKCPACYKKTHEKVRIGPTNVDEWPTNVDGGPKYDEKNHPTHPTPPKMIAFWVLLPITILVLIWMAWTKKIPQKIQHYFTGKRERQADPPGDEHAGDPLMDLHQPQEHPANQPEIRIDQQAGDALPNPPPPPGQENQPAGDALPNPPPPPVQENQPVEARDPAQRLIPSENPQRDQCRVIIPAQVDSGGNSIDTSHCLEDIERETQFG